MNDLLHVLAFSVGIIERLAPARKSHVTLCILLILLQVLGAVLLIYSCLQVPEVAAQDSSNSSSRHSGIGEAA
jgi:uncharacterized protein YybS (DUF2232 family)